MNYIVDIITRFIPVGLTPSQVDIFIAFGALAFIGLCAYILYKIARIFL